MKCDACRAGGPWLVTDMRRGETIFDINPQLQVTAAIVALADCNICIISIIIIYYVNMAEHIVYNLLHDTIEG